MQRTGTQDNKIYLQIKTCVAYSKQATNKMKKFSELSQSAQQRAIEDLRNTYLNTPVVGLKSESQYLTTDDNLTDVMNENNFEFTEDGKLIQ